MYRNSNQPERHDYKINILQNVHKDDSMIKKNLGSFPSHFDFIIGINIRKAQNIEGALSNLLQTKSSSTSNPSNSRQVNITHGWLLVRRMSSSILKHKFCCSSFYI
jgi:hypothetical protein